MPVESQVPLHCAPGLLQLPVSVSKTLAVGLNFTDRQERYAYVGSSCGSFPLQRGHLEDIGCAAEQQRRCPTNAASCAHTHRNSFTRINLASTSDLKSKSQRLWSVGACLRQLSSTRAVAPPPPWSSSQTVLPLSFGGRQAQQNTTGSALANLPACCHRAADNAVEPS